MNTINPVFYKPVKYIVLALLIYMPVFGFLDTLPIRIWDEGRVAINAYEMHKNGNLIVTYYCDSPDMWNTKPPLLIWCQVFFMKILGVGEVAIRLPSAIGVFCTCLAILFFSLRYLKNFWIAFIAILVLITSDGFINYHIARTGDYDALLTCFTTATCLFFFSFTETKKNKFLYLFFASALLAVLTKGVAGILFFPAFGLYCLFQKQILLFLKNKHFYIGLFSFVAIALGYYFLREMKNPGYLKAIQENELGGRFMVSQGNQKFNFFFYLDNFVTYRLADRIWFAPCGLLVGLLSRNTRIKKFSLFLFFITVTFLLIISSGKTKLEWYDAPLFPFISILIALFIYFLFELIKNIKEINQALVYNVFPYLFLFVILLTPYQKIWSRTYMPGEFSWDWEFYEIGHYLKDAIRGKHDLNGKRLVYDEYDAQNLFYYRILRDKGVTLDRGNFKDLKNEDEVIAWQDAIKQYIKEHYVYKEKKLQGKITEFHIYERLPEAPE